MKIERLNEDTIDKEAKAFADEIDAKVVDDADSKGVIEKALDKSLATYRRNMKIQQQHPDFEFEYPNILFVGEAGVGKTARIKSWAAKNGVNVVPIYLANFDATDAGGIFTPGEDAKGRKRAVRLPTGDFDGLDEPNSILFLDEVNAARPQVQQSLLTLIQDHTLSIKDLEDTGENKNIKNKNFKTFPNFMFTVAAMNPSGSRYQRYDLDAAFADRLPAKYVPADTLYNLNYLQKKWKNTLEMEDLDEESRKVFSNQLGIIEHLIQAAKDGKFDYDNQESIEKSEMDPNWNERLTAGRSMERLIERSENKDDFIDEWSTYCNNRQKSEIVTLFRNYTDVSDKANDLINNGAPFKKTTSRMDFLKNAHSNTFSN